jgi:hypothetical protein
MAMGSNQPLVKMSTRNISWGVKAAGAWGWWSHHLHVPYVMKSGNLNLLEPSGPHRACYGTALPSIPVSISIVMSLWRLCGCNRVLTAVSVLRHLAAAVAVQLHNSLPINRTALYESRIPYHVVEACSRPRHNLKRFLQILCFLVRSDSYRFLFPKTSNRAQSSFVVSPCLFKLMDFDSYQWTEITLTPPFLQSSASILSIIPFELFPF